jgi:hypothetical protein
MKCIPKELAEAFNFAIMNDDSVSPKSHTIRQGHRFKPGDKFSPRVWSGKPYRSKQIIIAPDIEVVKTWDFELGNMGNYLLNSKIIPIDLLKIIAKNDGFSELDDFECWFKNDFDGQVICWNPNINY